MIYESIFSEAILFIALFATMSVISLIVSRKNAKTYALQHPLQERKDTTRKRKLVDMYLNSSSTKIRGKDAVLSDLLRVLEDNKINKEEFKILKDYLNISLNL